MLCWLEISAVCGFLLDIRIQLEKLSMRNLLKRLMFLVLFVTHTATFCFSQKSNFFSKIRPSGRVVRMLQNFNHLLKLVVQLDPGNEKHAISIQFSSI